MALLQDLGYSARVEVWGDASAALGIINRRGLGKTRHIETGLLWIQQTVADQRLKYHKVLGKENPADLYTKFLDAATNNMHTRKLGYTMVGGRSAEAPQLHMLAQSIDEYTYGSVHEMCEWVQIIIDKFNEQWSPHRRQSARKICKSSRGEVNSVTSAYNGPHWRQCNSDILMDLGQLVLQGCKREVHGDQRTEFRPASPSLGFDPNPSAEA